MSTDILSWLVLLVVSLIIGLVYLVFWRPAVTAERDAAPLAPILCLPLGDMSFECALYQPSAEKAEARETLTMPALPDPRA